MSRREDRARKIEGWLEPLQSWKASGKPLSVYARAHGIEPWLMYHWRKILRREGRWPEGVGEAAGAPGRTVISGAARVPLRFARVKLDEGVRRSSLTVGVILKNGGHTRIELGDVRELGEVLAVLERPT